MLNLFVARQKKKCFYLNWAVRWKEVVSRRRTFKQVDLGHVYSLALWALLLCRNGPWALPAVWRFPVRTLRNQSCATVLMFLILQLRFSQNSNRVHTFFLNGQSIAAFPQMHERRGSTTKKKSEESAVNVNFSIGSRAVSSLLHFFLFI